MSYISLTDALGKLEIEEARLRSLVEENGIQVYMSGQGEEEQICFKVEDFERLKSLHQPSGTTEEAATEEDGTSAEESNEMELDIPDDPLFGESEDASPTDSSDDLELDLDLDEDQEQSAEEQFAEGLEDGQEDSTMEVENLEVDENDELVLGDEIEDQPTATLSIDDSSDATLSFGSSDDIALPDESFSLDEDESLSLTSSLSVGDSDVGLDGEDDDMEVSSASGPVTKIVDEPNINFIWPLLSIVSFGIIIFSGFVCFGLIYDSQLDQGIHQGSSFYSDLTDFVEEHVGFNVD